MGNPQRRKGRCSRLKTRHRIQKVKHYAKDRDQIVEDLKPEKAQVLLNQPLNEDLPGLGQFYCIECDRHFITLAAINRHKTQKSHKKSVKLLKEKIYTHEDAERFAGMTREVRDVRMKD